jgi:aminopeptidase N
VAVQRWRDIWLNEGFASYAEWLWGEHEGQGTADETFDFFYEVIDASDPFWDTVIGDPGAGNEFVDPVYVRGAMTLHVLRRTVGDEAFFTILRRWASRHEGGNGRIEQFIALSERVAGRQLDDVFDAWLFTSGKPTLTAAPAALRRSLRGSRTGAPTWAVRQSIERMRRLR